MDEQLQDKNNNGIPDWAEERFDDQTEFADTGRAYQSYGYYGQAGTGTNVADV